MKDTVNVYWAPMPSDSSQWNLLYPDPINLFSELKSQQKKDSGNASYLSCPAASSKFKNLYSFGSGIDCEYEYDFTNNQKYINPITDNYIDFDLLRPQTIQSGPVIKFALNWIFFADQPLIANFTPPIFHKPKFFKYASVVPGSMDIGQWYRPYTMEVQCWENKGNIEIQYNEPLFYVEFQTDKKIKLIRYSVNDYLLKMAEHCIQSSNFWGRGISLKERYKRFTGSSTQNLILNEINSQIKPKES